MTSEFEREQQRPLTWWEWVMCAAYMALVFWIGSVLLVAWLNDTGSVS